MECLVALAACTVCFLCGYYNGYIDGRKKGVEEGCKIAGKAVEENAKKFAEEEWKN